MEENNKDIEAILRQLNNKSSEAPPKFRGSDVEFEIGSEITPPEENKTTETVESPEEETKEDDAVSSIFDIAEKEESESSDVFRFQTTYMPRFTDATGKYSRIGYGSEAVDELESPLLISSDGADATAEIDEGKENDAKIVNLKPEGEIITETSTLFKFDDADKDSQNPAPKQEPVPEEVKPQEEKPEDVEASDAPVDETPEKTEPAPEIVEVKTETNTAVDIENPLPKKIPERYVPVAVAKRESITEVGDALGGNEKSEFTAHHKSDRVKDGFLDSLLSQKVRFSVALALSVILIIFENLYLFGVDLMKAFNIIAMPNALAIIDIQFVACIFLLALPEIIRGLKNLLAKRVTTELFLIPAFAVYLAYSLALIVKTPEKYSLFGILFAILTLSVVASSYLRTKADFVSFKHISESGEKKIVDNKYTRVLDSENFALDGVIEEYKSRTARVFKTSFVADFFRRTRSSSEKLSHVLLMTLLPLGVSFVISFAVYFLAPGFISAITAFALTYLLSVPAFTVLVRKLPHYFASEEAALENGALIGEAAYYDYAGIDVICFEDVEIFSSEDVNIQRIRLYRSNEDLTKALRQMSALFMTVGGPLDEIFSESLDKKCAPANGIIIKENGLIGEIDGKKVMAGSYDFMISEGVTPPGDEDDGKKSFDATTVMYAAENGEIYAKFYVRYRFSEEFTMLLPTLGEEKIVPLVYTRDPNLTNDLMKKLTAGTSTVRILKKDTTPVRDFAPPKLSAGMVCNGDKGNLVNLVLLARRYAKFNSRIKVTERSAMIVGLSLGALISVGGMLSLLPSALLSAWQLAWCVALYALTRSSFRLPKKKKEKTKNAK